jgi:hypothetical protein
MPKEIKIHRLSEYIDVSIGADLHTPERIERGLRILKSLPPNDANDVIASVLNIILTSVEMGLGVIGDDDEDTDDDKWDEILNEVTDEDMVMFDMIDGIYKKAHGSCYFCQTTIDPNEQKVDWTTHVCLRCKLKIGNFLEYVGIPRQKIFKIRKLQ